MDYTDLSKNERRALKYYLTFPWKLIYLSALIVGIVCVSYYVTLVWSQSKVVDVFVSIEEPCPGIRKYVIEIFQMINSTYSKPFFIMVSICAGIMIGLIINHIQRKKLLEKIINEKYLS